MPQDLVGGRVSVAKIARVHQDHVDRLSQHALRSGDIVFSRRGDVGRFAVITERESGWLCGTGCIRIRLSCPDINIDYIRHFLARKQTSDWLLFNAKGITMPNLNTEIVRAIPIAYPPLNEQKRIAAVLDKADQLRQKRRQAIALLDSLTQSIFLEMFGDLIENDKSFAAGRISDWVEDFETGKNLAPDPDNSDPLSYRVLKVSAVTSGIFKAEEAKALPKSYGAPLNHLIHKGDLLFSRANTAELIGATAMVHTDCERIVLPDKIWRFAWNAKNKPNPLFVHGMFSSSSFRGEISKRATGTSGSMKNISKEKVLNIRIGMPERQLQDDFAKRIEATQRCRLNCENQLNVLEAHFSSLQHRAFSGQL
ncbi:restriction endonuclease subunit S [Rhizobium leguminosarum]|uniref:restriction endonuclease subunit S n=1 Tax=Rhizobium leguminosarum TaxID=384 RepID=UPI001440EE6C|nr:restriction endonuclease subunit S [Rhizobium leguminosarum]